MRIQRTAAVAMVLALSAGCGAASEESTMSSRVVEAALPTVVAPPEPMFSRTIGVASSLKDSTRLIDACDGPVAIELGDSNPLVIAQHDYCGGSDWISNLESGDAVELEGAGIEPGLYVARELRFRTRLKATVADLPAAPVVLQTCVSETRIVLVGLELFSPLRES